MLTFATVLWPPASGCCAVVVGAPSTSGASSLLGRRGLPSPGAGRHRRSASRPARRIAQGRVGPRAARGRAGSLPPQRHDVFHFIILRVLGRTALVVERLVARAVAGAALISVPLCLASKMGRDAAQWRDQWFSPCSRRGPAPRQPQPFDAFALRPRVNMTAQIASCLPSPSVSRTLGRSVPIANGGPRGASRRGTGRACRRDAAEPTTGAVAAAVRVVAASPQAQRPRVPNAVPAPTQAADRCHEKGHPTCHWVDARGPEPRLDGRIEGRVARHADQSGLRLAVAGGRQLKPQARLTAAWGGAALRVLAIHRPVPQRRRQRRLWYGRRRRRRLRPMDV